MATNKDVSDALKLDSCGAAADKDSSVQVRIIQVPAKCGTIATLTPATNSKSEPVPLKIISGGQGYQARPSASTLPGPHGSSTSSVMVVAMEKAPGGGSRPSQQVAKQAVSQAPPSGRTVVITVPRSAAPPPAAPTQLPANIQVPPGMMLIRSDSGQLMLVSQQALAQAQHGPRILTGGQTSRMLSQQVSKAPGGRSNEKVTVLRMATPSSFQPAPVQRKAVVIGVTPKPAVTQSLAADPDGAGPPRCRVAPADSSDEPPRTFSPETLESVKKCKNFLVTLIKLASSDTRSAHMASNVRALVRSLLEGKMEPEEFTEQLYHELKSTPQPCLVPFLKKSLPAVRSLTADPQLFIQQASSSSCIQTTVPSNAKRPGADAGRTVQHGQQQAQGGSCASMKGRVAQKHPAVRSGKLLPEAQDPHFRETSGSYKEDDDINDVASMAGVNLREENAFIFTTTVGSVVQSCQDQNFLSPQPVLSQILLKGRPMGVTDVGPEVVALVSHATQERLRGLIEKLTVMAERRTETLKADLWHVQVSDVRSQLRFLEEIERLKKRRKDEEERETLLRLARSRSHTEDPQLQQLKIRAKELQQMEEAQLQHREANLTALAAIGPRKKRPLDATECQVPLPPRPASRRGTRVMLKDLLACMEQERCLRRSLTLYKALL